MEKGMSKCLALVLSLIFVLCQVMTAFGAENSVNDTAAIQKAINETAAYLYEKGQNAGFGEVGGEWTVIGLARSGYVVPEAFYQNYYSKLEEAVKEKAGVLHKKKYTEYSRVILALTAIGKDPTDVGGYNLLTPLGDYEKTVWQGLNGPIWALIALDSGNYEMPQNSEASVQATRQMYVDCILSRQLADGGWSLTGGSGSVTSGDEAADIDITGMALQALANYKGQPKVAKAIDAALSCMSQRQHADGGFDSWGTDNSESCVQIITALAALGRVDDQAFVKNGKSISNKLLKDYYIKGGGFRHTADGGLNQMATEQGFYGMVALDRALSGKNSLYQMKDHLNLSTLQNAGEQQQGTSFNYAELSFNDIAGNKYEEAIKELAGRSIINGMSEGIFAPESHMTRAQFATIITKSLGIEPQASTKFKDVPVSKWYAGYIGAANRAGIVNGRTADSFDPEGTITRQEAAVMVANAAKLCGMRTGLTDEEVRDTLAQFGDYVTIASWAEVPMAFCYANNIYDIEDLNTNPVVYITRGEIAGMLYNMLTAALVI